MANFKCTHESDILNKYTKIYPAKYVKVKTIINTDENKGNGGLYQVTIPYATNVQCPAGYNTTGILKSNGKVICEYTPPADATQVHYNQFSNTVSYTDPKTGKGITVQAEKEGEGNINYMTFTEGGGCVPTSSSYQGSIEQTVIEKNIKEKYYNNLPIFEKEKIQSNNLSPIYIPEKQTTHKIPTVNDIIPSETNPIIKSTTQTITQPTTKPNIFTFIENIISKYKYYILIAIAILIIVVLATKKK